MCSLYPSWPMAPKKFLDPNISGSKEIAENYLKGALSYHIDRSVIIQELYLGVSRVEFTVERLVHVMDSGPSLEVSMVYVTVP